MPKKRVSQPEPQVVLQPCSDPVAQANFRRTVLRPVLASDVLQQATDIDANTKAHFSHPSNQQVYLWGVKEKQGRPKEMWERMRKGDVVLFYADYSFILVGTVDLTFTSARLANHLWPEEGVDPDFSYKFMYAIRNPLPLYTSTSRKLRAGAPSEEIIRKAQIGGLREDGVVMGITVVGQPAAQKFLDAAPIVREYLNTTGKSSSAIDLTDPAINAQLDMLTEGVVAAGDVYRLAKFRQEQGQLRAKMLAGRLSVSCCICGKEYPATAITTAHIKKRSECTQREREHVQVVTPMCYLGCDFLYEQGYVYVDQGGKVRRNTAKATDPASQLHARIAEVEGNDCLEFTEHNARYYEWHQKFHGAG